MHNTHSYYSYYCSYYYANYIKLAMQRGHSTRI
jgi:hypothetical protein